MWQFYIDLGYFKAKGSFKQVWMWKNGLIIPQIFFSFQKPQWWFLVILKLENTLFMKI